MTRFTDEQIVEIKKTPGIFTLRELNLLDTIDGLKAEQSALVAAAYRVAADAIDDWKKWHDPKFVFLSEPPDSWTADVLRTMIPRIAQSVKDLIDQPAERALERERLRVRVKEAKRWHTFVAMASMGKDVKQETRDMMAELERELLVHDNIFEVRVHKCDPMSFATCRILADADADTAIASAKRKLGHK